MSATHRLLRFGVFELNLDTEELRKEGLPIKLGPQPFKVLAMLAARSGQLVSRDYIRDEIWGSETYVDFEHGLNQCIKQIRTALNDNTNRPLYIETIPRKGYRFLAPVTSKTVTVTPKVTPSTSGIQPKVDLPAVGSVSGGANIASAAAPAQTIPLTDIVRDQQQPTAIPFEIADSEKGFPPEPTRRTRRSLLGWLALLAIAAVAVGFYWHSQKANALTEKDTIVLADFENSTGDPVFDNALKEALAIDLDQSPYLNVLPDSRVREQTRLMGLPDNAPITASAARQVCQRAGSKAAVFGSIAPLGSHYNVSLSVENCTTGEVLAAVNGEADKREQVSRILQKSASTLRERLGESLASIQKYDVPIEQASTPSFEALKAYSLGLKAQDTEGGTAALPFYKRAIEIDPEFAMAYARMSAIYQNLNETSLAADTASKAFELKTRASEKERLLITGNYYVLVTGDLSKAAEAYTVFIRTYPREPDPRLNLSTIFNQLGKNQEALNQTVAALSLDPNSVAAYVNCSGTYLALNRFDDAREILKAAAIRKLEDESLLANSYILSFLTRDNGGMSEAMKSSAGQSFEDQMLWLQSETEAYQGKFVAAREYTLRSIDLAKRQQSKETADTRQIVAGLREIEVGNITAGMRQVMAARPAKEQKYNLVLLALALARGGDTQHSAALADALKTEYPYDTVLQDYWLPSVQAALELDNNNPEQAIKYLRPAEPYDMGAPPPFVAPLYPSYLRGLAYLRLGRHAEAIAEFQKILQHSGVVQNFLLGALAELQLGRAQALAGDKNAAAKSYQTFFSTWSEADDEIPLVKAAKAEFAGLNTQK